jgi:lysine 6-dehydrogenase
MSGGIVDTLVIGSGKVGRACVSVLAADDSTGIVHVLDNDPEALDQLTSNDSVKTHVCDATDLDAVTPLLDEVDCAIGATTPTQYLELTSAAIEMSTHWVDFGGDGTTLEAQRRFDEQAREAGIAVVPACGLAPGLSNMLATRAAATLESVREIAIRVGGLPRDPEPPLEYSLEFSVEGLVAEYVQPVEIIVNGRRTSVRALDGHETLSFDQLGTVEAFYTAGALATLPERFAGEVDKLTYKTVRYPGHRDKIALLRDLGFFDEVPVEIAGTSVSPRAMAEDRLASALPSGVPDVVVARVAVAGRVGEESRRIVYDLHDEYDDETKLSAMGRTTALPAVEIAKLASAGQVDAGVSPAEAVGATDAVLADLRSRGVSVTRRVE